MRARTLDLLALPGPTPMPDAVPTPAPGPAAPHVDRGARPLGVTILAVLWALGGLVMVMGGLVFAAGGALFSFFPFFGFLVGAFALFVGFFMLLVGLVLLVVGYGLWQGQPWAWTLSLVLVLLSLLLALVNLVQGDIGSGILGLLVNGFLLWYLTRAGVQRYFDKLGAWPAPQVDSLLDRTGAPK